MNTQLHEQQIPIDVDAVAQECYQLVLHSNMQQQGVLTAAAADSPTAAVLRATWETKGL